MDYYVWPLTEQAAVPDISKPYTSSEPQGGETAGPVPLVGHSDGQLVAVRSKFASWQAAPQDAFNLPTRPESSTGSARPVLSRTRDGTLVRVQRPARDPTLAPIAPLRLSSRLSKSSSVYTGRPERNTMDSAITTYAAGATTGMASGAIVSSTSGEIHMGDIGELEEDLAEYSSSEYGETHDGGLDELEAFPVWRGNRNTYHSCNLLEGRTSSPPQRVAFGAQHASIPPGYQPYSHGPDTTSWDHSAKSRAEECHNLRSLPDHPSRKAIWTIRLVQGSSYIMSTCSIVFPAMFLALGIFIKFMDRRLMSSNWSPMVDVIDIAAAIWPVAFAAVVAQCFKACLLYKDIRRNLSKDQVPGLKQSASPQRLDFICLLAFLIWSLSTFGSHALQHVYGSAIENQQASTGVWYVDQTGYNTLWSANSSGTMSAASRAGLVQAVSLKYIGSLAPRTAPPGDHVPALAAAVRYSLLPSALSAPHVSPFGPLLPASRAFGASSTLNRTVGTPGTLAFTMTVSHFNFTCGRWNMTMRNLNSTTANSSMSYSAGQTLGLSMTTGDTSHSTPAGSIAFASFNTLSNSTNPVSRGQNGTVLNTNWEYSAIQCHYRQYFYSVPIQCDGGIGTALGACVQSTEEATMLDQVGLSGTDLGDFAQDFVAANPPTTGYSATASEQYIQHGGPAAPTPRRRRRRGVEPDTPPAALNLSASVSPDAFARRFGHLFNTWVQLGYCPQCASGVLPAGGAGSSSSSSSSSSNAATPPAALPAALQPAYRHAAATAFVAGDRVYAVRRPWLVVFVACAALLLVAGIAGVALASVAAAARPARPAPRRSALWGRDGAGHVRERQQPCSPAASSRAPRSALLEKGMVLDGEPAHAGRGVLR